LGKRQRARGTRQASDDTRRTRLLEDHVIPGIEEEFPRIASRMSIMVDGSVGLGIYDEHSDLEASV